MKLPLPTGSTPSASLAKIPGRNYPGGYSDEDVDAAAVEDGNASVHNPDNWGKNTHPQAIEMINEATGAQLALVGHQLWALLEPALAKLDDLGPRLASAIVTAKDASNKWRGAQVGKLEIEQRLHVLGLDRPDPRAVWRSLAILVGLFVGDWALISVSFQILGLSDTPWIPVLAMTDDLHLAALASVVALVVLAHAAGGRLRMVEHAFAQRHKAKNEAAREALPKVSWLDIVFAGSFLIMGVVVVIGVGVIRIDYLAAQGVPVQAAPFIAIQLTVLAAAVAVSIAHTHPLARAVRVADSAEKAMTAVFETCLGTVNSLAGSVNTTIDSVGVILAQSGHHHRADRSNALRQGRQYMRTAILAQPEMTMTQLFPKDAPAPVLLDDDKLRKTLLGIHELPEFTRASTEDLVKHHNASVQAVRALAERFERVRLADLLPEDDELPDNGEDAGAIEPIHAVTTALPVETEGAA